MIVVLIHVTEFDPYSVDQEKVLLMRDREEARIYCGRVASGDISDVVIHKVLEVDTQRDKIKELELRMNTEKFKLELVEKVKVMQA